MDWLNIAPPLISGAMRLFKRAYCIFFALFRAKLVQSSCFPCDPFIYSLRLQGNSEK